MRRLVTAAVAASLALSTPTIATAGHGNARDHLRKHVRDRVEDRIDRRENRIDEPVDHGRLDVIEDYRDRWEDQRDRANLPVPPGLNRWERRSWVRLWCREHEADVCDDLKVSH